MRASDVDVDGYLRETADETLTAVDAIIRDALPGRSRRLWVGVFWGGTDQEIIGYADIVQSRPGGRSVDWFAIGLAKQKKHYSLYVNAADDGRYLSQLYADRLGTVKVGAAAVTFASIGALDREGLLEMLRHVDRVTPA